MLWWKSIVLSVPMSMMLMGSAQAETFVMTRFSTMMLLSLSECIKEAKRALKTEGFEENLDSSRFKDGSGSAWGGRDNGQYKAVIKCLPDHELLFFAVAGPEEDTVGRYMKNLDSPEREGWGLR